MSLFSRLFTKAPPLATRESKPVDPHRRADASLARAVPAQNDAKAEEAQRVAAVEKLGFGDELLSLASDSSSALQRPAQQRLAQLIDTGGADFSQFSAQAKNKVTLLSVAALTSDPARLDQVASSIDEPGFFFKLATEGPSTRLRQLAAEKIEDPAQLKQLLKDARGKDKNVFKIIKRKCDAINAEQRRAAEIQAGIVALGEAIERHGYKPFDGAFVATLDHFNTQWNAVAAEAPAELRSRVTQAIERGREVIANHLRVIAAQAAQASAIENADAQRQAVLGEMRKLLLSLYVADEMEPQANDAAANQLARWSERWKEAARYKSAMPADAGAFDSLRRAIPQLLRLITQRGTLRRQTEAFSSAAQESDLTANYQALKETLSARSLLAEADLPVNIAAAETVLGEWEKSRADKEAAAAAALRQLGGLIRKAGHAIDEGRTGQAAGLRRAIADALLDLPSVPGHLSGALEQLDRRLSELQDWKSYAVAPKRVQLIEQMESLLGSQDDPNDLADRIRRLQDEWKAISKGGVTQSEADWERFHRAAQTAYQPCRDYFAAQARIRQENLDKRRQLVAELAEYENSIDWDNASWRDAAQRLRIAKQDWRSFSPTERAATKPLQDEFDVLVGRIQGRLDAEYTANIERKQSLILQAQRLAGESDTRKAIDEIKRLQSAWKTVGVVPRLEDQQLWEAFRQHCDAVYKKSQQEYTQLVAEVEGNKAKAVALCAEAEQLAGVSGAALFESAPRIKQLREEFRGIGDLHRADANELNRRFERAVERFDSEVAQQRTRDEGRRWDNLLAASNEVRLLQLAMIEDSASGSDAQSLRESARALIDSVQQWPKGGRQAIEDKLNRAAPSDVEANEAALRTLCIRAEILTDTPTPPADQALRRNYQLQSLVQGLGRPTTANREQLESMVFEWINVGAIPTTLYGDLLERFRKCWIKAQRTHA
jgi:hypothetical protein